ncbi:hypothetical protein Nepgr_008285 [Nepenthes gracilis]|uniref:Uncharacterized protein n=1 Tax=Nepenthes gracilis TaxID=150966 RepID=A0AAD3S8R9_NEPGR|nr:hypothetical protein Nepgr_008285 [Nepenthes gracilis]
MSERDADDLDAPEEFASEQKSKLKQSDINGGMLPEDIVNFLASREKQVFLSDTEEEEPVKKLKKKTKRPKKSGVEPVILKDIPPAPCLLNSLKFFEEKENASLKVLCNFEQF